MPISLIRAASAVATLALALAAPSASATFHNISIREVFPGSAAEPGAEYVELQMWASGQGLVKGHSLKVYGPGGGVAGTTTFAQDVGEAANQSTILLATPGAESSFGVDGDAAMAATNQLDPAGGAVCWIDVDCVSWGSFSGALPSSAGAPAPAIPDGMAIRRSISPGCPTFLEASDDHDDSAADFAAAAPAPRPNSTPPSEVRCSTGGQTGGSGGAGDRGAPQTILKRKPARRTRDRTPTFRFVADESGSTFQCRLDGKRFRLCRSPFTGPRLAFGPHTFRVRARDRSGKLDPTPASYRFRVVRR